MKGLELRVVSAKQGSCPTGMYENWGCEQTWCQNLGNILQVCSSKWEHGCYSWRQFTQGKSAPYINICVGQASHSRAWIECVLCPAGLDCNICQQGLRMWVFQVRLWETPAKTLSPVAHSIPSKGIFTLPCWVVPSSSECGVM